MKGYKPILVVLAAGMASRYGGNKQIEKVGLSEETLMEFSIYDAIQVGFSKVVFVIREDFAANFMYEMESKLASKIETAYVFQDLKQLTEGKTVNTTRTKPYGTQHALLCAAEAIDRPFAVINADDFYGRDAFEKAYNFLTNSVTENYFACIGYSLKHTLSTHGAVTRGEILATDGLINKIIERKKIAFNGKDAFTLGSEPLKTLALDTPVSMNFFCLHPSFLSESRQMFDLFLDTNVNHDEAEFLIPEVVDELLTEKKIEVQLIETSSKWFGVTYKEDAGQVKDRLAELVLNGVYPRKLWKTMPETLLQGADLKSRSYTTKPYDYLIVGSGLFGAVFAHEANKRGKKCLVIDKRNHLGGNVYTENVNGINVHTYGAHIFHTNDKRIWDYVNSFVEFNNYINSPIANYKGDLYNLPFNMNTFYQLWKVKTPAEAKEKIRSQIPTSNDHKPANLEEQAISLVGTDIYLKLIKGYTEKQWGRSATELPAFIIKRLPVRFTYDNNYFTDKYQGIPIGGYNKLIEGLLAGIDVKLEVDYFQDRAIWDSQANQIVFTGKIDQYYDYRYGQLNYRSLRFEHEIKEIDNAQGNAVVNYTEAEIPYTRIIEHKHFEFGTQDKTVVTKEYPEEWDLTKEPYYPVNDNLNNEIYLKYRSLADQEKNVLFGGRLAEYRYYDMHQVIGSALKKVAVHFEEILAENSKYS